MPSRFHRGEVQRREAERREVQRREAEQREVQRREDAATALNALMYSNDEAALEAALLAGGVESGGGVGNG